MVALILGLIFVLFAVYSVLPFPWALNWWQPVLEFLRGGVPIIALIVGVVAVLIGIADIKDRIETKKEDIENGDMTEGESEAEEKE